jgi:hypothetical protein
LSEACASFNALIDRVEADGDLARDSRRQAKGAAVISRYTINRLMETRYQLTDW